MSELIGIDVEGIPQVARMLDRIASPEVRAEVTKAVAKHIQGVMRKYPPYRYVSRQRAYGQPFKSARQRRWFFAALRDGRLTIPYNRTERLKRGWKIVRFSPSDHLVTNEVPYAKYVQGDEQSRMMMLRYWRRPQAYVEMERARIDTVAVEAYNRAIKRL